MSLPSMYDLTLVNGRSKQFLRNQQMIASLPGSTVLHETLSLQRLVPKQDADTSPSPEHKGDSQKPQDCRPVPCPCLSFDHKSLVGTGTCLRLLPVKNFYPLRNKEFTLNLEIPVQDE